MNNSYYILAKEAIHIERLHICTWEFTNADFISTYIGDSCLNKNTFLPIIIDSRVCKIHEITRHNNCR